MTEQESCVVVFSGGMDSTSMLYMLQRVHPEVRFDLLSFNYGQRHAKELDYASRTAAKLGLQHDILDIGVTGLSRLLSASGSSLVSSSAVPEGHYAEDNMKATVVPNRNMIMLAMALGVAVARNATCVATAVHAGDHFIYPDCRPDFIMAMSAAANLGNEGFGRLSPTQPILVPFINRSKAYIAQQAIQNGMPFEDTWSCYQGGDIHCGKCGTCVERLEAIHEALANLGGAGPNDEPFPDSNVDKTLYADEEFWKEAVANAK
jgi:7-cyano-7-deazaguanine synthase